jgi:hypothetical protein
VWLVTTLCPTCGVVDVFWRGNFYKRVNLRADTFRRKALVRLPGFGRMQRGTLKIRVASTGKPVRIQGVALQGTDWGAVISGP